MGQLHQIPKLIHFIWVGHQQLPDQYIYNILDWAHRNPDFAITLWVDRKGTPAETIDAYLARFKAEVKELLGEEASEEDIDKLLAQIELKDITEEGVSSAPIRYEIDSLRPNYGAASDLIRYNVLYKYGGAYFDVDVITGEKSLAGSEIFAREYSQPQFFSFYPLVSTIHGKKEEAWGNDSFICSPKHPIMKKIAANAHTNYRIFDVSTTTDSDIYYEDSPEFAGRVALAYYYGEASYFKLSTMFRTGPSVILKAYAENKKKFLLLPKNLRYPEIISDASWLDRKLPQKTLAAAVSHAVNSILFETKYQRTLRLDYHIATILEAVQYRESVTPTEAAQALLHALANESIDYKKITGAQLTFSYPETELFYKNHDLLEKTFLFPKTKTASAAEDCKQVIMHLLFDDELKSAAETMGQKRHKPLSQPIKEHIEKKLPQGIQFLTNLLANYQEILTTTSDSVQIEVISKTLTFIKDIYKYYYNFSAYQPINPALKHLPDEIINQWNHINRNFPLIIKDAHERVQQHKAQRQWRQKRGLCRGCKSIDVIDTTRIKEETHETFPKPRR